MSHKSKGVERFLAATRNRQTVVDRLNRAGRKAQREGVKHLDQQREQRGRDGSMIHVRLTGERSGTFAEPKLSNPLPFWAAGKS